MNRQLQQGLSLIEIMIALVLGLLLILGVFQIFTGASQSVNFSEASSRVQESGRIAIDIISRALRNADYWGCSSDGTRGSVNNRLTPGAPAAVFDNGLMANVSVGAEGAVPGTEVLTIAGAEGGGGVRIVAPPAGVVLNVLSPLYVNAFTGLQANWATPILLISDCDAADIFQASGFVGADSTIRRVAGVPPSPGNATVNLSKVYPVGAEVLRVQSTRYMIQDVGGRRGLYMQRLEQPGVAPTVEVVEGVVDMQLRFGVGNDPQTVTNWVDDMPVNPLTVLAVQVELLVRSTQDGVVTTPQTICYPSWNCVDTIMADRNLYRIYSSTVTIRNRN